MVGSYLKDLEREDAEKNIAKEIVRAIYKIKLPKETKVEVEEIIFTAAYNGESKEARKIDYELLAANTAAYTRLVDILIAYALEEEMALIMAMIES